MKKHNLEKCLSARKDVLSELSCVVSLQWTIPATADILRHLYAGEDTFR